MARPNRAATFGPTTDPIRVEPVAETIGRPLGPPAFLDRLASKERLRLSSCSTTLIRRAFGATPSPEGEVGARPPRRPGRLRMSCWLGRGRSARGSPRRTGARFIGGVGKGATRVLMRGVLIQHSRVGKAPDTNLGGQEFESLRARQRFQRLRSLFRKRGKFPGTQLRDKFLRCNKSTQARRSLLTIL